MDGKYIKYLKAQKAPTQKGWEEQNRKAQKSPKKNIKYPKQTRWVEAKQKSTNIQKVGWSIFVIITSDLSIYR